MKTMTLLTTLLLVPLSTVQAQLLNSGSAEKPPVFSDFEIRLATDEPGKGLIEVVFGEDDTRIYLNNSVLLTKSHVAMATATTDGAGNPAINIQFTSAAAKTVEKITSQYLGKRLAVLVAGKVIWAPVIRDTIRGDAMVTGDFSAEEARKFAGLIYQPAFSASMLLIKADWSEVKNADKIERELRDVLAPLKVREKHLQRLPESATEILFPHGVIGHYSPKKFQSLLKWLHTNELIVRTIPFSKCLNDGSHLRIGAQARGKFNVRGFVTLSLPLKTLGVPEIPGTSESAFVSRGGELRWQVMFAASENVKIQRAEKTVWAIEKTLGQEAPKLKDTVDVSQWTNTTSGDPGTVSMSHAFPAETEERFRSVVRRKGIVPLLVIRPQLNGEPKPEQEFCLPEKVDVLSAIHDPQYRFMSSSGSSGSVGMEDMTPWVVEVFVLSKLSAKDLVEPLVQLYGSSAKIEVDEANNRLLVNGPQATLDAIQKLIQQLEPSKEKAKAESVNAVTEKSGDIVQNEQESDESRLKNLQTIQKNMESRVQALAGQMRLVSSTGQWKSGITGLEWQGERRKSELHTAVSAAFSFNQQLHSFELLLLEKKLQQARDDLKNRRRNSSKIIERRVEELLTPQPAKAADPDMSKDVSDTKISRSSYVAARISIDVPDQGLEHNDSQLAERLLAVVKTDKVLKAAIDEHNLYLHAPLSDVPNRLQWLRDNLILRWLPSEDQIEVGLAGDYGAQQSKIVNAVVWSFNEFIKDSFGTTTITKPKASDTTKTVIQNTLSDSERPPANDVKPKLLVPQKSFVKEGNPGAVRLTFNDIDLLKVLNMERVSADVVDHFPDWLRGLNDKQIRIRGFMYPAFSSEGLTRFVLARDNDICCFGKNPKVYDLVDVQLPDSQSTEYVEGQTIDVEGTFHISPESDGENVYQLYRISNARILR